MSETNKILQPITYYPAAGKGKTSQRRPIAFISGSEVDNLGGAVASQNTVAGMNNTRSVRPTSKEIGSKVVSSDEAGSKFVTGSAPGAVDETLKISVPNRNSGPKTKQAADVSAAPTLGILSSAGATVIPGGHNLALQKYAKHVILDEYLFNSTLDTNTNFNTLWEDQDPSDDVSWSSEFGGTLTIASANNDASAGTLDFSVVEDAEYLILFDYMYCVDPEYVNLNVGVINNNGSTVVLSLNVTRLGHHVISFTPSFTGSQVSLYFLIEAVSANTPVYIKNVRIARVVSRDINVSLGADNEKGRFKSGAATIQTKDWAGA